jgi:hypothetical protein
MLIKGINELFIPRIKSYIWVGDLVTLIDHIYTSRPEEVMQVRVSTYCPGDHYPVNCSVKYGKSNKSEPRVNR